MMRGYEEELVRAILGLQVGGRRGRGRPKMTWEQVIRAYMIACEIEGSLAQDKRAWTAANRRPDPSTDGGKGLS